VLVQLNGMAYTGLDESDLSSVDHAARSSRNSSVRSSHHQLLPSTSSTQQLEQKSIAPDVANTLEHIVGQLDILTQVPVLLLVVIRNNSVTLISICG